MGLRIRPLTLTDVPEAAALLERAFKRPRSYSHELTNNVHLQPDGWLLATLDGRPAGAVGAIDYGVCAWVGMMGVEPELQGRGIARALLVELLVWLEARGCPLVVLDASDAGAPLYVSSGFVDRDAVVLYGRDEGASTPVSPTLPVSELRPTDLAEVLLFDRPLFDADRGAVLDMLVADNPGRAFLSRDEQGRLNGYIIAQQYLLGPWVATSPEAAETLLVAALALPFAGAPGVQSPLANTSAASLLPRYGFSPQRRLRHMVRGAGEYRAKRDRLYGQASFALG